MNIRVHHVAQRLEHHSVALQRLRPAEPFGDYPDTKVALAILRAGVAGVQMAIVDDLELCRREGSFEVSSNRGGSISAHGMV